ncbi:MAG: adenylosuccinate synthase [Armatimonadia bacterium]|nr:adenylosuccinate synthase [Armatimonadia bacterium]
MSTTAIVGTQWGDEGKGRFCDVLAEDSDLVVRFQGGNNAGHTVVVGDEVFKFHLVPSGILRPETICLLADGTVIDPKVLCSEIEELRGRGIDTEGLKVSGSAHVIMPYHVLLDQLEERSKGDRAIGTTARGIGPCYADKASRVGIRVWDLVDRDRLARQLGQVLPRVNVLLEHLYDADAMTVDEVIDQVAPFMGTIEPLVVDGRALVMDAVASDAEVLFEGAQGTFIDLDHGTYPFVTSSHPISGAATIGTGLGPLDLDAVLGIAKSYTTRVGAGPFPAEAFDEDGDRLRESGAEFGTTTGRARRCGWFDSCMLRTAVRINSVSSLALTKLDVLDELETIRVVTAYELDGELIDYVPSDPEAFGRCVPVYEDFAGWQESLVEARELDDLPASAHNYVEAISTLVEAPISAIAVGPEREQTVWVEDPAEG